jgi:SHS2 domain-containing protein
MPYRFVDHTGDVAVDLDAPDVATLFADAADALTDTLVDRSAVVATASREVRLASPDLELLLVDWLSELLFAFEAEGWLTRAAAVRIGRSGDDWSLHATVRGERFQPERHQARVLVKAITYHALAIHQTASGATARVVFDI